MKATIWHNPECSTSRRVLALLEERGDVDLTIVEYLRTPPTREKLAQLYAEAGMRANEGVRSFKTDAEERGLTTADDATVLDAMEENPRLIQRPLVETDKGVRLCRPPEMVLEIL